LALAMKYACAGVVRHSVSSWAATSDCGSLQLVAGLLDDDRRLCLPLLLALHHICGLELVVQMMTS
jgi:hypothetical protein